MIRKYEGVKDSIKSYGFELKKSKSIMGKKKGSQNMGTLIMSGICSGHGKFVEFKFKKQGGT